MTNDFYCPTCNSYFIEDVEAFDTLSCPFCHEKLLVEYAYFVDEDDETVHYLTVVRLGEKEFEE